MVARSKEVLQAEIVRLRTIRKTLRHYSMFSDDRWAAIDAQIDVLSDLSLDEDDVQSRYGHAQNVFDDAVAALEWRDGESDARPSDGWEGLY